MKFVCVIFQVKPVFVILLIMSFTVRVVEKSELLKRRRAFLTQGKKRLGLKTLHVFEDSYVHGLGRQLAFFDFNRVGHLHRMFKETLVDNWVAVRQELDVGVLYNLSQVGEFGEPLNHAKVLQNVVERAVHHVHTLAASNRRAKVEESQTALRMVKVAYCSLVCQHCMLGQLTTREFLPPDAEATPRLWFGCSACLPNGEWDAMRIPRIFQSGFQPVRKFLPEFHFVDALLCHACPGIEHTLDVGEWETQEEQDFRKAVQFAADRVVNLRTALWLRNNAPAVVDSPTPDPLFSDEDFDAIMRTLE